MKLLQKIKNFFKKSPKQQEVVIKPVDVSNHLRRTCCEKNYKTVKVGTVKITTDIPAIEQLTKKHEEQIRKQILPEPTIHRRTLPRNAPPPAERHRAAISKHMKGKGRTSVRYRKMIKTSPKIKIEEDD